MRFKFKISSKIFIFMSLLICISFTSVSHAAWDTVASDYITDNGENIIYRDGAFWYGQYGIKGSLAGYRYNIVGFTVKVTLNGKPYSFDTAVGGTFSLVNENEKTINGKVYLYSLWKLDYNDAVFRLKKAYPNDDFDALSDKSINSTWGFDGILTVKNPNDAIGGYIDDYGNVIVKPVYKSVSDIAALDIFKQGTLDDMNKLFGNFQIVYASSKPTPIYPTLSYFGIYTYDYKEGNTYWAKPTTEVRIFNESWLPKKYGVYPDVLVARIYKGNYSDGNYHSLYLRRDGSFEEWTNGAGVGNIIRAWASPMTYDNSSGNYMSATYGVTFPQDGETFRFRNISLYNGQYDTYIESDVVLKIDGTSPSITGGSNEGWVNEDKIITIKASDYGSGIASIELNKYGSIVASETGTTLTYTNTSTGNFTVVVKDNVGNYSTKTFYHNIDKTKPSITGISTIKQSWQNTPISVTIDAVDTGGSGLSKIQYKLEGAINQGWVTYDAPFDISTNGITKIYARAIDNAGNYSAEASAEVWYDEDKPTTSISTTRQSWKNTAIPVTINSSDTGGSGVAKVEYKLEGAINEDWTTYNGTFNISTDGQTTITARTTDNAGNVSAETSAEVWYDGSKPSVNISTIVQTWKNTPIPVMITANDTGGSGVKNIQYKLSGAKTQGWTSFNGTLDIIYNGKTTITARSLDYAGNYSAEVSAEVWFDNINPTMSFVKSTTEWCKTKDITIIMFDGHSGGDRIVDLNNNITYNVNAKTFTITDNGTYNYRGYDVTGNYTDISVVVTKIDKIKPTVEIITTASQWKNVDVPVTLKANDNETGVARIEYTLSGATTKAWGIYSSVFNISNNGITNIQAKSIDKADNVSDVASKEVWVDKTKPTGIFTTPSETITRDIVIKASSLSDTYSGVKEVRISNVSNYATYASYSVKDKTSDSLNFEIDKKSTVAENYTDRIIYVRLIDVAGNFTDYQLKIKVNPAPPAAPTITLPDDTNLVYISGEIVDVNWTHNNGVNDFILPQTKATLILVNNDTGYTQTFVVDDSSNEYYLGGLPNGQYTLTITTNNFGPHTSQSTSVRFRYNKFLSDGLVRTLLINPVNDIGRLAIVTDSEIPKGCSIEGKIYYKTNADGSLDYTVSMPFKIDSDGLNKVYVLPEVTDKLQVDLILKNITNPKNDYLSPILDRVQIYAR